MSSTKFRVMIGRIAFAHPVAAADLGALAGFVAIWAIIFAMVPLAALASAIVPGVQRFDLPSWAVVALLCGGGLARSSRPPRISFRGRIQRASLATAMLPAAARQSAFRSPAFRPVS